MKNIKSLLLATAAMLGIAVSTNHVSAQRSNMPIHSVAAGVGQNLLLITNIEGSVSAPSLLHSNGLVTYFSLTYAHRGVPTAQAIAALIRSQTLSFLVANKSNDWVSFYLSYRSADGDSLFWGGNSYKLKLTTNGTNVTWKLPSTVNLTTYLSGTVFIYESNALYATFILRDKAGYVLSYNYVQVDVNYNTRIGKIRFPEQFLGQRGELIVTYAQRDSNGEIIGTYDVAFDAGNGGRAIQPVLVSTSLEAGFSESQLVVLNPPNIALNNVYSYDHQGSSPLVQFTVDGQKDVMLVTFSAQTTEGENAIGFGLKKLVADQNNPWEEYIIPAGATSLTLGLRLGEVYHVDYRWSRFAPATAYPWWYYGKGGIGIVGGGGAKG